MRVLDASVFIRDVRPDGPLASVPSVRDELTGAAATRFAALAGGGMDVHEPDVDAVDRVRTAATASGDADVLSEADVRVIAAALDLDATVVSDDYAVQNVARRLDLSVESIDRGEIDEVRVWRHRCTGCGRVFDEAHDRCPVCGSGLERVSTS